MRWSVRTRRAGRGLHRRASVLVAVLLAVAVGSLVVVSMLPRAEGELQAAGASMDATRLRAAAWSALQVHMDELASQREALIEGGEPTVRERIELWGEDAAVRAVAEVVEVRGRRWSAEAGRVDINTATAAVLAGLPGLNEGLAGAIIAARPFDSPEELLRVPGITVDVLYGVAADDELRGVESEDAGGDADEDAQGDAEGEAGAAADGRSRGAAGGDEPLALIDLVTTFAFDPVVQAGVGRPEDAGQRRFDIRRPWREAYARPVSQRWGEEAVEAAKGIMSVEDLSSITPTLLVRLVEEPEEAGAVLDWVAFGPADFVGGLIDINRAPAEVLSALPGMDRSSAEAIVLRRGAMEPEQLKSVAWPAVEGLVTRDVFVQSAHLLATRSLQWRMRLEVRLERGPADGAGLDGAGGAPAEGVTSPSGAGAPAGARLVLDVVVDVASARPRIAYLRDVTALDAAIGSVRGRLEREAESAERAVGEDERETGAAASGGDAGGDDGVDGGPGETSGERLAGRRESREAELAAGREGRLSRGAPAGGAAGGRSGGGGGSGGEPGRGDARSGGSEAGAGGPGGGGGQVVEGDGRRGRWTGNPGSGAGGERGR